mmetsp:Transcript_4747/g.10762  ORF Transcript_4747/g.10762 Transcript_4747/m.10762 type:complete len:270 (+) Transcript_4747:2045-2854(+)
MHYDWSISGIIGCRTSGIVGMHTTRDCSAVPQCIVRVVWGRWYQYSTGSHFHSTFCPFWWRWQRRRWMDTVRPICNLFTLRIQQNMDPTGIASDISRSCIGECSGCSVHPALSTVGLLSTHVVQLILIRGLDGKGGTSPGIFHCIHSSSTFPCDNCRAVCAAVHRGSIASCRSRRGLLPIRHGTTFAQHIAHESMEQGIPSSANGMEGYWKWFEGCGCFAWQEFTCIVQCRVGCDTKAAIACCCCLDAFGGVGFCVLFAIVRDESRTRW